MKASSAPGPDGIPASIYKQYDEQLLSPIMKIWRTSLDTGNLPEGFALAIITPIFKGRTRSLPANYRPVALTSHLTKIFERVLRKELVLHPEINELMNPTQHCFRAGRSIICQLLHFYDDIFSNLEEKGDVDTFYLDFDKVDHNVLRRKISCLKIGGKVLRWIKPFLRKRKQAVRVEKLSSPVNVISDVPQGSVLGPLFFLILMFDIDKSNAKAAMGSFADDTCLWHAIKSLMNSNELQRELMNVYTWADMNNMKFDNDKFELISIGLTERSPEYYTPSGESIERKEVVKDLGIHFQANLTFHHHVVATAAKGHRMAG